MQDSNSTTRHASQDVPAGELGGSALAGIGAILLAAGSGSNAGVTLIGDLVCLASSCCFLVYMAIGRSVRSWMGLFVYVLPVNLVRTIRWWPALITVGKN